MRYRRLGRTNLQVSEIGLGAEWLERHTAKEIENVVKRCEEHGVNILDCWMAEPNVRTNLGNAIHSNRDKWIVQGHFGSTQQGGQYVRTRSMPETISAFEDFLRRFQTDYVDLGLMNYVDELSDWNEIVTGDFLPYMLKMKDKGHVRYLGLSTHNPSIARLAVESGAVDMFMFSLNPAFDLLPASEDINTMFQEDYTHALDGINPERAALYRLSEQKDVGITVMKGYAGGRLFDEKRSPFGVRLTPVQCIHYCLTRPAVASVMVGCDTVEHVEAACAYETATDSEKDYAGILANAPKHAYHGQCTYCGHCKPCPVDIDIAMVNKLYDLAAMQETVPDSIKNHYEQLSVKASACLGCGGCDTRCPFGVNVSERMQRAALLLG